MQAALESVDGVDGCEVDYAAKTATVMVGTDVDTKAMVAALEEAGYTSTVAK